MSNPSGKISHFFSAEEDWTPSSTARSSHLQCAVGYSPSSYSDELWGFKLKCFKNHFFRLGISSAEFQSLRKTLKSADSKSLTFWRLSKNGIGRFICWKLVNLVHILTLEVVQAPDVWRANFLQVRRKYIYFLLALSVLLIPSNWRVLSVLKFSFAYSV